MMAQLRNNPKVKVNVDDYRDMMVVLVLPVPDADTERCFYCQQALGVCECIPAERAILNDDSDEFEHCTIIDAEFEPV